MSIAHWPIEQRPREKLLKYGAARLSDAELLAVFLRTGMQGKNVIQMAQELLNTFGGVAGLFGASAPRLQGIKGMGATKCVQLLALRELATRILASEIGSRTVLSSPQSVRDYLRLSLMGRDREVFAVVFLDTQHQVIDVEEMFFGTLTQASVYPREVVRRALALNAAAVILAHNHPSGVAQPSQADEALTRILCRALQIVDVKVLDHFVIGGAELVSFAERGLL